MVISWIDFAFGRMGVDLIVFRLQEVDAYTIIEQPAAPDSTI